MTSVHPSLSKIALSTPNKDESFVPYRETDLSPDFSTSIFGKYVNAKTRNDQRRLCARHEMQRDPDVEEKSHRPQASHTLA
jgi:hypothetical protein